MNSVDFAAIAGRENEGFRKDTVRTEFFGGAQSLLMRERDFLSNFDGSSPEIQANENNFHA